MDLPRLSVYEEIDFHDIPQYTDEEKVLRSFTHWITAAKEINIWFDGLDAFWNEVKQGKATEEILDNYHEASYKFENTYRFALEAYVKGHTSYGGDWGQKDCKSYKGTSILKSHGLYERFSNDMKIVSQPNFFETLINIFERTDKMISMINQFKFEGKNSYLDILNVLPELEQKFTTVFSQIAEDIANAKTPTEAKNIAVDKQTHIYREVLPSVDEDEPDTWNQIVRQYGLGFTTKITFTEIVDLYRRFSYYLGEFIKEGKLAISLYPKFAEYYEKPIEAFTGFLNRILDFTLEQIRKAFPKFVTQVQATNAYQALLQDEEFQFPENIEKIKKMKRFIEEECPQEAQKFIDATKAGEANQEKMDKLERVKKDIAKTLKQLEKAKKKKEFDDFKSANRDLKSHVTDLEAIGFGPADEEAERIKGIIQENKSLKNQMRMDQFMKNYSEMLVNAINQLKQAVANNEAYTIPGYQASLREIINVFESSADDFEGDVDELKSYEPYVKLLNEAKEALEAKAAGGKSPQAMQAEQIYLPQINAYLPSITMMVNMPPNAAMVPQLFMMKGTLTGLLPNLMPYQGESPEIKAALDNVQEAFKKIDEYAAKCA